MSGPRATSRATPEEPPQWVWLGESPAFLRAALVASTAICAIVTVAAGVRHLPQWLAVATAVPAMRGVLLATAASALPMAIEVGVLFGWSIGWVEHALVSVERGESRARLALGEGPDRRIVRLWPGVVVLLAIELVASHTWGQTARSPGKQARMLIERARVACVAASRGSHRPEVIDVPAIEVSWACVPDGEPLLLATRESDGGSLDLSARAITTNDDLSQLVGRDVQLDLATSSAAASSVASDEAFSTPSSAHVRVSTLHLRVDGSVGSSIDPWLRAVVTTLVALGSAWIATRTVVGRGLHARPLGWSLALVAPAIALVVIRHIERTERHGAIVLVAVPVALGASLLMAQLSVVVREICAAPRRSRRP